MRTGDRSIALRIINLWISTRVSKRLDVLNLEFCLSTVGIEMVDLYSQSISYSQSAIATGRFV